MIAHPFPSVVKAFDKSICYIGIYSVQFECNTIAMYTRVSIGVYVSKTEVGWLVLPALHMYIFDTHSNSERAHGHDLRNWSIICEMKYLLCDQLWSIRYFISF